MSIRLDELAAKQFGVSEQEATALIMEGRVWMGHIPADKPGTAVKDDTVLTLRDKAKKYASRSGYKLEKALHVFPFDVKDKDVCDIGASNGGFTDCMLQYGAKHVWSVDVAYGILEWRLRCDERVTVMERTNARKLTEEMLGQKVDRITADVSFISLTKLFPAMNDILKDDGLAMLLI
ncbi:MAG: TlyA family RNA methyltransferase, partial [Clostridia bacterium]|nr:TlyA family RNA methyltransferase [Clostridia bacterium]